MEEEIFEEPVRGFRRGDRLIGIANPYLQTSEGWIGYCMGYDSAGQLLVYNTPRGNRTASFHVDARYFRPCPVRSYDNSGTSCVDCGGDFDSLADRCERNGLYRCETCHNFSFEDDEDIMEMPWRDYDSGRFISMNKANNTPKIVQSFRGFGVEIEAYGPRYKDIQHIAEDIDHRIGISEDGSLNDMGFELQFPLINGLKAEKMVKHTCAVLAENKAKVDETCGYHLHLEALPQEQGFKFIQRAMFVTTAFEDVIRSFIPVTRRSNRFCFPLRSFMNLDILCMASSKEDLELIWYRTYNKPEIRKKKEGKYDSSRYNGFNFHCYLSKMKHLEVRHHTGTLNCDKILHWANLHTLLLDAIRRECQSHSNINSWPLKAIFMDIFDKSKSKSNLKEVTTALFDFIKLSGESQAYFLDRQVEFKN